MSNTTAGAAVVTSSSLPVMNGKQMNSQHINTDTVHNGDNGHHHDHHHDSRDGSRNGSSSGNGSSGSNTPSGDMSSPRPEQSNDHNNNNGTTTNATNISTTGSGAMNGSGGSISTRNMSLHGATSYSPVRLAAMRAFDYPVPSSLKKAVKKTKTSSRATTSVLSSSSSKSSSPSFGSATKDANNNNNGVRASSPGQGQSTATRSSHTRRRNDGNSNHHDDHSHSNSSNGSGSGGHSNSNGNNDGSGHDHDNDITLHMDNDGNASNGSDHSIMDHKHNGNGSNNNGSTITGFVPSPLPPLTSSPNEQRRAHNNSDTSPSGNKSGNDDFQELLEAARMSGNEDSETIRSKRGCVFMCLKDPCARAKALGVIAFILAGVAISIILFFSLRDKELGTWRDNFNVKCEQRAQLVREQFTAASTKMESYFGLMASLLAIVNSSDTSGAGWAQSASSERRTVSPSMDELFCTHEQFQLFSNASNIHDVLDYVLFLRYVRASERALYESSYTPIRYRPVVSSAATHSLNWTMVPSNDYYLPLQTSDPRLLIGYDITGWDLRTLDLLNLTTLLQNGVVTATGRSSTILSSAGYGILISLPIFSGGSASISLDEKEKQLVGVVVAILPVNSLLESALKSFVDDDIQVSLQDPNPIDGKSFYMGTTNVQSSSNGGENTTVTLPFATREYTLICTPSSDLANDALSWYPTWIAIGTAVLFAMQVVVIVLGSSCQELQRAVRRSEALVEANQSKNWAIAQLERARITADAANASKTDFMAFLCHELRNPLHAVVSMLEFLEHAGMAHEDLESVLTIRHSVNMMRSIVNDALDMTKIESGNVSFETVGFSLREIVQTLWRVERSTALGKGLDLQLFIDPNLPSAFYGDPTRLRQVLINFVTNAIKFTKNGSIAIHLRVISNDEADNNSIGYPSVFTPDTPAPPPATPPPITSTSATVPSSTALPVVTAPVSLVAPSGDATANSGSDHAITINPLPRSAVTADNASSSSSSSSGSRQLPSLPSPLPPPSRKLGQVSIPLTPIGMRPQPSEGDAINVSAAPEPAPVKLHSASSLSSSTSPITANGSSRVTVSTVSLATHSPTLATTTATSIILAATPPITATAYAAPQPAPSVTEPLPAPVDVIAIELKVVDTGMGIEKELLPRLFEPYSQAKLSIMRDHGGTGLGLAIVARIIRMMGGHVFVESTVSQGSSFKAQFRLPVAPHGVTLVSPGNSNNSSSSNASNSSHTSVRPGAAIPTSSNSSSTTASPASSIIGGVISGSTGTSSTKDGKNASSNTRSIVITNSQSNSSGEHDGNGSSSNSNNSRDGDKTSSDNLRIINTDVIISSPVDTLAAVPSHTPDNANSKSYDHKGDDITMHGVTNANHDPTNSPLPGAASSSTLNGDATRAKPSRWRVPLQQRVLDRLLALEAEQKLMPVTPPTPTSRLNQSSLSSLPQLALHRDGQYNNNHHPPSNNGDTTNNNNPGHDDATTRVASPAAPLSSISTVDSDSPMPINGGRSLPPQVDSTFTTPSSTIVSPSLVDNNRSVTSSSSSSLSSSSRLLPVLIRSPTNSHSNTSVISRRRLQVNDSAATAAHASSSLTTGTIINGQIAGSPVVKSPSSSNGTISRIMTSPTALGANDIIPLATNATPSNAAATNETKTESKSDSKSVAMAAVPASTIAALSSLSSTLALSATLPKSLLTSQAIATAPPSAAIAPPKRIRVKELQTGVGHGAPPAASSNDCVARYGMRRCLVVDDAIINVKILVRLLHGFKCDTGINGVEAVNATVKLLADGTANGTQRQYDVILTDVIMPVMDGIQAARDIRLIEQAHGLAPVPIIAITANAMAQDRLKCVEAGMSFLAKPFVRDDLYRLLDALWLGTNASHSPVVASGNAIVVSAIPNHAPLTSAIPSNIPSPALGATAALRAQRAALAAIRAGSTGGGGAANTSSSSLSSAPAASSSSSPPSS